MSPVLTRKQLQLCLLHLLHQSPGVPRLLDPTLIKSVDEDEDEVVDEVEEEFTLAMMGDPVVNN